MIRVSAPGKTILMGEHAAVYGRPALVAAIDRRLRVELEEDAHPGPPSVRLDLAQIDVDETVPWADLARETDACRRAWNHYQRAPSPERFAPLETADPARVVRLAIGETAHDLRGADGDALVGACWTIRVRSEIPIGAGFGSSAAIAVAVVRACLEAAGVAPSLDRIDRIALDVERRQHGLPSGVDSATVARGGILWVERRGGDLALKPVSVAAPKILESLRVFDTGTPAETTGTVVSAVRARRDADPEAIDRTLDSMRRATAGLRRAIESPRPDTTEVIALIRRFEADLETLGVVPEPVRTAVRRVESDGGAAKISGAGGLRGPGAGSLLVYDPSLRATKGLSRRFTPVDVRLGGDGVRLDDS